MLYRRHSFAEKLNIVSQFKNGHPLSALAKLYNLDRKMLREWVRKYDLYGESGLQSGVPRKVSVTIKDEIVSLALDKSLSLPLIALQYGVSISSVKSWINQAKVKVDGSFTHPGGKGQSFICMGRPKKREPRTELEKLQAENARLRAENDLLKKVTALVQEREARDRMSGLKPSRN